MGEDKRHTFTEDSPIPDPDTMWRIPMSDDDPLGPSFSCPCFAHSGEKGDFVKVDMGAPTFGQSPIDEINFLIDRPETISAAEFVENMKRFPRVTPGQSLVSEVADLAIERYQATIARLCDTAFPLGMRVAVTFPTPKMKGLSYSIDWEHCILSPGEEPPPGRFWTIYEKPAE